MGTADFTIKKNDNISLVYISGSLDVDTAPSLKKTLENEIGNGHAKILCNMKDVDYIASVAVGIFVHVKKLCGENNGGLVLSEMKPAILKIFEVLGFQNLFAIYKTDTEGIDSLK